MSTHEADLCCACCPCTGEITAAKLRTMLKNQQKSYEKFQAEVGAWGSGVDPFGNSSHAGKKQMSGLETESKTAHERVCKLCTDAL